jgi:branched-chain amino acid transport system permease protein
MADPRRRALVAVRGLDSVGLIAAVVLVLVIPNLGAGNLSLATSWLILAILAYGVDLVYASTRHMSLVHAALWGVSAYVTLGLQSHRNWNFWQVAPAAVVASVVVAALIALVAYRLNGLYFSILTFVIGEILVLCFTNLTSLTGGASGTFGALRPSLFGVDLSGSTNFFYLTAVTLALVIGLMVLVRRSTWGRMAMAIGDNESQALALGVRSNFVKRSIFVLSAIPTGVSGVFYGTFSGAIQPSLFGGDIAIALILIALLGGSGFVAGPLIGAAVYIFVPAWLPWNSEVSTGVVGLVFILLIRMAPRGIWPALRDVVIAVAGGGSLRALLRRVPQASPADGFSTEAEVDALLDDDESGEKVS